MKRIKRVIPTESLRFSFSRHGKYDIEVTKLAKTCDDNSEKSFSDVLNAPSALYFATNLDTAPGTPADATESIIVYGVYAYPYNAKFSSPPMMP